MKRDKESKATPAEDSGSGAEGERMKEARDRGRPWKKWGPYPDFRYSRVQTSLSR